MNNATDIKSDGKWHVACSAVDSACTRLGLQSPRETTQTQSRGPNQMSADPSSLSEVPPSYILFSGCVTVTL